MAKIKNPLFSFTVTGSLGKIISFRKSGKQTIAEKTPIPTDLKSLAQLSWRHMYQKAVALWHALSPAEQAAWETQARPKHMTGFAWFMSQCLKPNPGIYLPLQGGIMQGDIDMATHKITNLPDPIANQEADTLAARNAAIAGISGSKIQDADADTKVDTEESADEDMIRMDVAGVEAFHLDAAGVLTLAKQSAARAYLSGDQTITTGTWTLVHVNSTEYDIQSEFDTTNHWFKAKTAGLYIVFGSCTFEATNSSDGKIIEVRLYKNNNLYRSWGYHLSHTGWSNSPIFALAQLAVDDYIDMRTRHNFGANATLNGGLPSTSLAVAKIA